MKKILFYILLISLFLLLSSCIFKIKPPKAILTYPPEFNNLPTTIDLFWTLEGNEKNNGFYFEIYYGKSATLFDNKISTSNTSIRLENLEPETEYYIKIRTIKGNEYTDSEIYKIKTTDKPKISFVINNTTIYKSYIELKWSALIKMELKIMSYTKVQIQIFQIKNFFILEKIQVVD
ncbi:fibronectin type III domain-containing protein [Marinitoga lauensis]|uniref:fibronectin type III domain-containing protein n=1 Tax=Marinitoga lauensis TaxID=2201189 RepID=UPI001010E7F9|nr:fibronectin type III domain-containing protein [Marinitoga lauensis]